MKTFLGVLLGFTVVISLINLLSSLDVQTSALGPNGREKAEKVLRDELDPPSPNPMTAREHLQRAKELVKKLNPADYYTANVLGLAILDHGIEAQKDRLYAAEANAVMTKMSKIALDAAAYKAWNSSRTELTAQMICRQSIEARLKAPATAQWSNGEVGRWDKHPKFFLARYTVDSQNSFGAMLRTAFECEAECFTENACVVRKLNSR